MPNKFYITSSIVYCNSLPHIGFAFELIQADVLARYHRQLGHDTWFLTGTDEHGLSVSRSAKKANMEPQKFVDEISAQVINLSKKLNISNDDFIRTSDKKRHWPTPIKLWQILYEKGDIYKKKYKGLYCVGHESFIKKTEMVDGLCPLHQTAPEELEEENWFFKITKYKKEIVKRIERDELQIIPFSRKNEILNIIKDSEDVSVSRPADILNWGIPVPNDPSQTLWVWIDALSNYISALGYAENDEKFEKFWPANVHLVGKDILRFHALTWCSMLLSADLPLPRSIFVHGFINIAGQKMSKTIGNVVDPFEIINKYGVDAVRYFLLREIPSTEDGDFSEEKLVARYNGDLANGLGNLVARVATLIETNLSSVFEYKKENQIGAESSDKNYHEAINQFRLHEALADIWTKIGSVNTFVNEQKPWLQAKDDSTSFIKTITTLVVWIHEISWLLTPFLPETAQRINDVFGLPDSKEIPENYQFKITKGEVLFPRI